MKPSHFAAPRLERDACFDLSADPIERTASGVRVKHWPFILGYCVIAAFAVWGLM